MLPVGSPHGTGWRLQSFDIRHGRQPARQEKGQNHRKSKRRTTEEQNFRRIKVCVLISKVRGESPLFSLYRTLRSTKYATTHDLRLRLPTPQPQHSGNSYISATAVFFFFLALKYLEGTGCSAITKQRVFFFFYFMSATGTTGRCRGICPVFPLFFFGRSLQHLPIPTSRPNQINQLGFVIINEIHPPRWKICTATYSRNLPIGAAHAQ